MALPGEVTLPWGDGRHAFGLALGQVRELEEKAGVGVILLARRLTSGEAFTHIVVEVIRLGLIGGGMSPVDALTLVERYGPPARPLSESVQVAYAVLLAFINGVPQSKKKPARPTTKTETPQDGSTSPPSTAPAQP